MRISESELIINPDGSIFHLHIRPEQLADNVILVGDPGRVELAAKFFDTIESRTASREFISCTGTFKGKRITVLSTGIGTDNIDIVVTELDALANIDFTTREVKPEHKTLNILRIGTSGTIQDDIPLGSYVFSHISLGMDSLMNWYGNRDQVVLKDFEEAFMKQVHWSEYLPKPYFVQDSEEMIAKFADCTIKGMTISASGFYGPQGRQIRVPLALPNMIDEFAAFEHKGYKITNFEMEGSAIAGLCKHLGHHCGTVCYIIAQRKKKDSNPDYKSGMENLIKLCLERI